MSKLGNVYELDFNTRMKNKYPVVYMNDEYIVCKRNDTKNSFRKLGKLEEIVNAGNK